ncbi:hypothetical protein GGU45_004190 [Niabella hirudinis]
MQPVCSNIGACKLFYSRQNPYLLNSDTLISTFNNFTGHLKLET